MELTMRVNSLVALECVSLRNLSAITALILAVNSYCARAEDDSPGSIPLGNFALIPTLDVQEGYDDNFLSLNENPQSSWLTIITPTLQLVTEKGIGAYRLTYALSNGDYASSSADNYTDHQLAADAIFEPNFRHRITLNSTVYRGHEARGTDLTEGAAATSVSAPIEYKAFSWDTSYRYGAEEATGRLEFKIGSLERHYLNFRSTTESKDRDELKGSGAFYYKFSPKTHLVFEVRQRDINYLNDTSPTLDSTETKFLVGADWQGTALTSGSLRVGQVRKNFDSSSREDFSGLDWEAGIAWAPKTYSVFNLTSGRTLDESTGTGDFIDAKSIGLSWHHEWMERLSSDVGYTYTKQQYAESDTRNTINTYSAGIDYQMRRWLKAGLSINHTDKSSSNESDGYKRNQYVLTMRAML
ncbi:hypothetical protein C4K68_23630 [Pokkaliibacter plantistimulans]|uniref:TIGR03016 family PEP-CTERM system-associated outer membrane protein n=1 Tax=Proteobacteria bacterium 228 TaxID=2083153 RepID=A0A2S5KKX6_9PROT|nr:outer membrane beta-barrel protein [Pokkaliibacter plantistimulans]PPC74966.1 hypothetical protein C4K68_23630 [Pokkaliibacter plantistimulans]